MTECIEETLSSTQLFNEAQQRIPGGVNSPVRAFGSVGGTPRFIESASGCHIQDVDGKRYIDYVCSWGPMILGHANPDVITAVQQAAASGLSFGAPCLQEIELAKLIIEKVPSIEKVRMVNSGTEAAMSAIRLARAATGKNKIIKCAGGYHGHVDSMLVQAGSGSLTFSAPSSPGVPEKCAEDTLVAQFNDLDSYTQCFEQFGDDIAAIIIEPIAANMNLLLPKPGFLQGLRDLCNHFGAILIFDEVMTGFRVHPNSAQALYGIQPDLTMLGKIVGGGLPVGAFGGRSDLMDLLSPVGDVYQAGTLSGNPITMTAGIATLQALNNKPHAYERLAQSTQTLVHGLQDAAHEAGCPIHINYCCGMFGLFFTDKNAIESYAQVLQTNLQSYKTFFHHMLEQGVYLPPSPFEAIFVSLSHELRDIDQTLQAAKHAFKQISQ